MFFILSKLKKYITLSEEVIVGIKFIEKKEREMYRNHLDVYFDDILSVALISSPGPRHGRSLNYTCTSCIKVNVC